MYDLTLYTDGSNCPDDPPSGTWAPGHLGTVYQVGDVVTYNGATYRCLQAHQAQAAWTPANVPALWQRV